MRLYSYWRSGTSYRVRLALSFKGAEVELMPVNLLEAEHKSDAFLRLNPQGLVPSLELDDGTLLSQSPAIIEYIDEALPGPKLLPETPFERARARHWAAIIGCDVHPLQNLRILKYLQGPLGHNREEAFQWAAHWITEGLSALEEEVAAKRAEGPYVLGPTPSIVDCYLLPQLYAARRFGADLSVLPKLLATEAALLERSDVQAATPEAQPDAPQNYPSS